MLSLGRDCKQPLRSLTRICENGKWKMENFGACGAILLRVLKKIPKSKKG